MIRRYTCPTLLFAILLSAPLVASAQSANQGFTVVVPGRMAIAVVNPTVTHNHDETDDDQALTAEQWTVKGNKANGVTVTFSTTSAFTNTTDTSYKNDVTLALATASTTGPATWTIDTATDTTNYGASDEIATVQASSDKPGRATFNLSCTCMVGSFWDMLEGNYQMTVTGTVTAN